MLIELKGVEFENKGAELMLCSIVERINTYWPDAEVALSPGAKSPYSKRAKLGALQKLALRKSYLDLNGLSYYLPKIIRRWLRTWGVVTEADIDVIVDASGFSYSDQWGSDLRIRHAIAEAKRLSAKGKKYIFMPQAMGPFKQKATQELIKNGFPYASLVCARDDDSYQAIASAAGEFGSLRQYKDFTNVSSYIVPEYFTQGDTKVCFIPNKNMVNPRNKNKAWLNSYKETFISLIHQVRGKGLEPFFLNHEGAEDGALIEEIAGQLDFPIEVIAEPDPLKVKGIIKSSKLTICSRYHGCVSALSSGLPCLGTSWSHKYERLYEEYQASSLLLVPSMSEEKLSEVLQQALEPSSQLRETISQQAEVFKEESERLWLEVREIIDGNG